MAISSENTSEKRGYPRIKRLDLVSFISKSEGRQTSPVSMGRTLDISPSGVRVEIYRHIKVDSVVEMEISIHEDIFAVQGKVAHVTEIDKKIYIVGIQFDEIQHPLNKKNERQINEILLNS